MKAFSLKFLMALSVSMSAFAIDWDLIARQAEAMNALKNCYRSEKTSCAPLIARALSLGVSGDDIVSESRLLLESLKRDEGNLVQTRSRDLLEEAKELERLILEN